MGTGTLADRLTDLGRDKGRGWQAALARYCGVKSPSVADWASGKTKTLEGENLLKAADFFEVEPLWLASGRGGKYRNDGADPTLHPLLAWEHESDLPEGQFVLIPQIAISEVNSVPKIELRQEMPMAFRADWVRERHLSPSRLGSLVANGDAMEDRIHDGDAIVVDTGQLEIEDGHVYAIRYERRTRVRRLYRTPGGGLRVKSDKAKYPELELSPEEAKMVFVVGRVVHVSGEGGL